MKTVMNITIDNMIRNYCYNFLSYLYSSMGWKRALLETSKELYIDSLLESSKDDTREKIRIVITQDGKIFLRCYTMGDILLAIETIESHFAYGRMKYYLFNDENVKVKTQFTSTLQLEQGPHFEFLKERIHLIGDQFKLNDDILEIKYSSYEEGKHLFNTFLYVLASFDEMEKELSNSTPSSNNNTSTSNLNNLNSKKSKKKKKEKIRNEIENIYNEDISDETNKENNKDNSDELIIFSFIAVYSLSKLFEVIF
jgi:hypothetical protein